MLRQALLDEDIERLNKRLSSPNVLRAAFPRLFNGHRFPMSQLAEDYFQHWQAERSADGLVQFLAAHPDLSVVQLIEVLLVDQALEWKSEPGPSVEHYLQLVPVVANQRQYVMELVYGEMRAVRALNLPVDADAYTARFPDLAEPLRRQIEVSAWLADEAGRTKTNRPRPS